MRGGPRTDPAMDWKFVERVRDYWKGKFMIKGIDTHEDAKLALDHGLDLTAGWFAGEAGR